MVFVLLLTPAFPVDRLQAKSSNQLLRKIPQLEVVDRIPGLQTEMSSARPTSPVQTTCGTGTTYMRVATSSFSFNEIARRLECRNAVVAL